VKPLTVLISVLLLAFVASAAQAQRDPCRDEEGNEICPHFNANDGRVNPLDPLATTTAYCQSDKAIHVYSVINSVGEFLFRSTEQEIASALGTATGKNQIVTINAVRNHQLVALPSGNLRIQDFTGFSYTFAGSLCGGPAFAPNPNPVSASAPVVAAPPATTATRNPATSVIGTKVIAAKWYTTVKYSGGKVEIVLPTGFSETTTITARVNLRSKPFIAPDTLITVVPAETIVQVLGREETGAWLFVLYDGAFGWLATSFTGYTDATIAKVPVIKEIKG
jgi:hypothetical protein